MKKYIIILALLPYLLFAQSKEPEQQKFDIKIGSSIINTLLSADSSYFNQQEPIFGWHWTCAWKMTQALRMNAGHTGDTEIPSNMADSIKCIILADPVWSNGQSITVMEAPAIQYEPTLWLNDTMPWEFKTNLNDPTNPVFGFKYINSSIDSISTTKRLVLKLNGGYTQQIVLDTPCTNHHLYYNDKLYSYLSQSVKDSHNCRELYLSINLRRHNLWDRNTDSNYNVLKISMPFARINGSTGTIKFDQIPKKQYANWNQINSTLTIYQDSNRFRGYAQNLETAPKDEYNQYFDYFYITKSMLPLPDSSDDDKWDNTISAHFICDAGEDNNPKLHLIHYEGGATDIRDLNVKVQYLGESDIEIDWIRIETPAAQTLFRGKKDLIIQTSIQAALNHYTQADTNFQHKGIKPFRFYTRDEANPSFWGAFHYFNKLVGNLGTTSQSVPYTKQFEYYVNPPEYWNSFAMLGEIIAAPYFRYGHNGSEEQYLGFNSGFLRNTNYHVDSLYSYYETFLPNGESFNSVKNCTTNYDYMQKIGNIWSFQAAWERKLFEKFHRFNEFGCFGTVNDNYLFEPEFGYLYSRKPWWAQIFINSLWTPSGPAKCVGGIRPKTGEEIRLLEWTPIIMGAKGFVYDGEGSGNAGDWYALGIGQGQGHYNDSINNLPDSIFLSSDYIGRDFLHGGPPCSDYSNIDDRIEREYLIDTMETDTDSMYVGRKSVRLEIKKTHDWMLANADTLMRLQLLAWYGKGYKVLSHQHPDSAIGLLGKYIDTNGIKTRPIDRDTLGEPYYENYHGIDSCFYDVTMLRDTSQNIRDCFFIGAVNRRTDPLIYYSTQGENPLHYMRFVPTAEFQDRCTVGGADTLTWQDYWWKRLGCREITIPFNYNNTPEQFDGYVLHVSELGVNSIDLDTLQYPWRESPKYYHKIDTTITEDGSVVMRMLPGQGKILKVEVSSIAGNPQQDTCDGCEKLIQNISVQTGSGACSNDSTCQVITLTNNSQCNYDSLNFAMEYIGSNPNAMSFSFSSSGWGITRQELDGKSYMLFNGSLQHNNHLNIDMCYLSTDSFNLKFYFGTIIGNQFFECDSVLDSLNYDGFNCNDVIVSMPIGTDSCACNECSYNLVSNPIDTCFADSWQLTFKGEEIDSTVNGNGFTQQGSISMNLCIRDGIDTVIVNLMKDSSIVCSKELVVVCNKCDIFFNNMPSNKKYFVICPDSCPAIDDISLFNLSDCIELYDFIEVREQGDTVLLSDIPTFGADSIYREYCIGEWTLKTYKYVFKDNRGNILCEKTVVHDCGIRNRITLSVELVNPQPFCCGGITLLEKDTTLPAVYAIGITEQNYPNQFVYFDRRDSNQLPFDFSSPGYYVTDLCVPEDSTLIFNIRLFALDTSLVAAEYYEGSCLSEKLNSELYIGKFEAYPNPTDKSVTFSYELKQSAYVKLELYDHMGNIIDKIFSEKQDKGFYKREYYTYDLKEGLYYAVLWAENEYKTIGIIVMH